MKKREERLERIYKWLERVEEEGDGSVVSKKIEKEDGRKRMGERGWELRSKK